MSIVYRLISIQIVLAFIAVQTTSSLCITNSDINYRLPGDLFPEYYRVDILTNLADVNKNFTFNGRVWILIKCTKPTNRIVLHSKNLEIIENEVTVSRIEKQRQNHDSEEPFRFERRDSDNIKINNHCYHDDYELYFITLDEQLEIGDLYAVSITYHGVLTQSLAGYYRSSYTDLKTGEKRWLAVTQFESTDARRAFPCFDEPVYKAKFQVNLGHSKQRTSISNMRIMTTTPIENMPDWVWDQYEVTVPMSTYLLAFIVTDFSYKMSSKSDKNDVEFRTWARSDAIDQVNYACLTGPRVLEYFEKYFDVKYPLPKLDMVAIPDFSSGAMENWGLITYRETSLLYDPKVSTTSSMPYVASVIAHEIAHQWFGNLVTMNWWTDLWLNEGFATYVAALGVNYLHPEWNSLDEELVDNMINVFSLDSLHSSHPISVPIGHPREIPQIFDTISYRKGSFALRMMNLFLGEDIFRAGVSKYLKKHAFSNAEQDDLWESLTIEAHKSGALPEFMTVKTIMDSWTLQTGYPLISVIRDYETETAMILQERFLADRVNTHMDDEKVETRWWVPLSYTTQFEADFNDTRPKHWLGSKQQSLLIKDLPADDWVVFNIALSGIYRVKYDEENWKRLIRQLMTKHRKIGLLNRIQLIEDSMELAKTGDIDYQIPFNILKYLEKETEYLPWKTALKNLGFVEKMLRFYPSFGYFRKFMQNLLFKIYKDTSNIEYENTPENLNKIKHQTLIAHMACKYGVGNCKEKAIAKFREWMEFKDPDSENPIAKDHRNYVYCTAIKHGGEEEWNFLWNRYRVSNVGNERTIILNSLGCSREVWLLNRYLDWSIDENSGIRKQDSLSVFVGIARGEVGYFLSNIFFKNRISDIYKSFGSKTNKVGTYVNYLASQITTESELNDLTKFTQSNEEYLSQSQQAVKQGLENSKINIQWQFKFYKGVSDYLESQQYV